MFKKSDVLSDVKNVELGRIDSVNPKTATASIQYLSNPHAISDVPISMLASSGWGFLWMPTNNTEVSIGYRTQQYPVIENYYPVNTEIPNTEASFGSWKSLYGVPEIDLGEIIIRNRFSKGFGVSEFSGSSFYFKNIKEFSFKLDDLDGRSPGFLYTADGQSIFTANTYKVQAFNNIILETLETGAVEINHSSGSTINIDTDGVITLESLKDVDSKTFKIIIQPNKVDSEEPSIEIRSKDVTTLIRIQNSEIHLNVIDGKISIGDSAEQFKKLIKDEIVSLLNIWAAQFNTHVHPVLSSVITGPVDPLAYKFSTIPNTVKTETLEAN